VPRKPCNGQSEIPIFGRIKFSYVFTHVIGRFSQHCGLFLRANAISLRPFENFPGKVMIFTVLTEQVAGRDAGENRNTQSGD
jgi:hypothetical protein